MHPRRKGCMRFSLPQSPRGSIGIAFADGGATLGQATWNRGDLRVGGTCRIEGGPRDIASSQWRNAIAKAGFSGTACSIAIPAGMTHQHVVRIPAMSDAEMLEAASWELAERLGLDRDLLDTSATRLGEGGDVFAVAVERNLTESILEPLYAAGLRPTTMEPQAFAVARLMSMRHRRCADREDVRAVLDIGGCSSSMLVLCGDQVVFCRHLAHRGDAILDAVCAGLGVDDQRAMSIVERFAGEEDGADADIEQAVRSATRPVHDAIVADVVACLRHYGVTSRGPAPTSLIITGSFGWNRHLAQSIATACNIEVARDSQLPWLEAAADHATAPGWQAALGASLERCLEAHGQRAGAVGVAA